MKVLRTTTEDLDTIKRYCLHHKYCLPYQSSLSEFDIAKSVASLYLETSVSTLDITLPAFLSRRRSGTSPYRNLHSHQFTFNDTSKATQFFLALFILKLKMCFCN